MNKKILIVDDSRVSRMMMRSLLGNQRPNWEIAEAAHGEEALKLAEKTNCDVFSLDLNMPGMDGLALADALRRQAPLDPAPLFFLLTANVQEHVMQKALLHRVTVLHKPITEAVVTQLITSVEGRA